MCTSVLWTCFTRVHALTELLGLMTTFLSTMFFIFWLIILEHKLHITGFFVGLSANLFPLAAPGSCGAALDCGTGPSCCGGVSVERGCGACRFSGLSARAQERGAVAPGLSCCAACGIVPDQGSNPCLLHLQVDSLPLSHQGSLWWLDL